MSERVDLHIHTTASDGSVSPVDVVNLAVQKRVKAIAITDHDTTDGLVPAMREGERLGIEVIAGIELSTHVEEIGSLHLLGLWIKPDGRQLQSVLSELREGRLVRNEKIMKSLADLGVPVDIEQIKSLAKGKVVGRLHIATAMIERGYVSTTKEAFETYLGFGKPAYFGRRRLEAHEAIDLIKEAGGVAVLAHPGIVKVGRDRLEAEIRRFVSYGLGGIEAIHTDHSPEDVEFFTQLASKYKLAVSGGSDFHGDSKPGVEIGSQAVSHRLLADLMMRRGFQIN